MAGYCTNCGAKLEGNPRFCGNCGKPCAAPDNSGTVQNSSVQNRAPVNQGSSGGIGKFLAGTAVGAFFMHLFGNSSSASASSAPHMESAEHYHETVVYGNHDYGNNNYNNGYNNDYDYGAHDDNSSYDDDCDTGDSDFDNDSYDDYGGFDDSYDD